MNCNEKKLSKLSDIIESASEKFNFDKNKIILINTSDVFDGKVLNHNYVPNKNIRGQFKKSFKKNDILYSEIRPKNKRFAYIDFDSSDYVASTKLMVLRKTTNQIDNKFLYFLLTSDDIINHFQFLAESRSGTFPQITFSEIKNYQFILPNLLTQKKIASILSTLDDKIELNNKINKNLEEMAQAIFKSWFVDFEPWGGEMPEDWKYGTLDEISKIGAGGDKPSIVSQIKTKKCNYPIFSNGIKENGLYGFTNRPKILNESITISARGTIGFICLRHEPFVPIVRLISLVPYQEIISAKYLFFALKRVHIAGTGTTQQQLTIPAIKKTKICIPKYQDMKSFTKVIDSFYNEIYKNQIEIEKLIKIRDTLLPKLMSGELDVSNLDI